MKDSDQTYANIKTSIQQNWKLYSDVVQRLPDLHWYIPTTEKLVNHEGKPIVYDNNLETWKINAYASQGSEWYLYGIDRDKGIEIWAYFDISDKAHHLKSVFVRDYGLSHLPGDETQFAKVISKDTKTLAHSVIKMTKDDPLFKEILPTEILSIEIKCPVDAELIDPEGLILNKSNNEITDASYEEKDIDEDGDSDIYIIVSEPKKGNYTLNVIPRPDSKPEETFSAFLIDGTHSIENPIVLANNVSISGISSFPYVYSYTPEIENKLVSSFTATPLFGFTPLSVTFKDTSSGNPTSKKWSFGDSTFADDVTEVVHTYNTPGDYNVTLMISGPDGEDTESQVIHVLSAVAPTPDSTITPTPNSNVSPFPGLTNPPTDLNGDGLYEDINGNGRKDYNDIVVLFNNILWVPINEPIEYFDFNKNGRIDYNDIVVLFDSM